MSKQNYNLNFSEAQDYISKRGLDVVWNDCDIFIDEHHITESVANVLKWADEHPKEEVVEIKKVVKWLALNAELYGGFNSGRLNSMVECFKQDMMEE